MDYRFTGLPQAAFSHLFGASDAELARHRAQRFTVDAAPGFPDRVTLHDALPGESVLLVNFTHQPADTPYRASHAIFVTEGVHAPYDQANEIPPSLRSRMISLRAFDASHSMVDADVAAGEVLEDLVSKFLGNPAVAYLHAHYARRGCYAARVDRT